MKCHVGIIPIPDILKKMLPCLFKTYFGFDCPGCGAQRSVYALLKGNLLESLALYPALIPFALFMTITIIQFSKGNQMKHKWIFIMGAITLIIMLGHYILKVSGLAPWFDQAAACSH